MATRQPSYPSQRKRFNTIEWTMEDTEANEEREQKLIAYARRIGLGEPFRDSFDEEDRAMRDRGN